jgi:glycosyltransferase involved in cell wall biosynthesis
MAEALAERGHDVHVVTYHLGGSEPLRGVDIHRTRNVPFYNKLSPGPSAVKLAVVDPLLALKLRRTLREQRFDVLHAHHYEGLLVAAAARVGTSIPLIYDAHTLLRSELRYYGADMPVNFKARFGGWLDLRLPKLADHTVCVTESIRERLTGPGGLDPERASVIMNGVEVEHFAPARAGPRTDPRPTVIFAGNLAAYQGVDLLLRAFAKVTTRVTDARLVIASGSSFAEYEPLARELGIRERLELLAPTFDELPALLMSADVAANPRPDGDGVPVKMLNYMAAGRAVVSFAGSAPGVVHRENGWLAARGDVAEFADGLAALLEDPALAREIGQRARQHVLDHCRWSLVAERCEAIYRSLLDARAPHLVGARR